MLIKTFNTVSKRELDFPLWLRYEPNQPQCDIHTHRFVELVIITGGTGTHISRYSKDYIRTGSVFAIPFGGEHGYEETNKMSVMNILFDPKTLPMPRLDLHSLPGYNALFMLEEKFFSLKHPYPIFHLDDLQLSLITPLISLMQAECDTNAPGNRFILLGTFMTLLGLLARDYSDADTGKANHPLLLGNVISYLNTNYHKNITLTDLLKCASMSKSTLLRNFFRATGNTPIQYLTEIRLEHACTLLHSTTLPIADISLQVGFTDPNYFTRTFSKTFGKTPLQYRKFQ